MAYMVTDKLSHMALQMEGTESGRTAMQTTPDDSRYAVRDNSEEFLVHTVFATPGECTAHVVCTVHVGCTACGPCKACEAAAHMETVVQWCECLTGELAFYPNETASENNRM